MLAAQPFKALLKFIAVLSLSKQKSLLFQGLTLLFEICAPLLCLFDLVAFYVAGCLQCLELTLQASQVVPTGRAVCRQLAKSGAVSFELLLLQGEWLQLLKRFLQLKQTLALLP